MGQENQTQKTIRFNTVGRKTGPKDHIWAKTIYGQRPYMGKDHIWDSTQWDRETRPKDHRIQHSWDSETRPNAHIWAKTIYGIQHSGTGKPDPKTIVYSTQLGSETRPKDHIWAKTIYGIQHQTQRPYMGFNTVGQGNQTQRPYRIQHSWDSETRSKDHIWDSYGQRPYMGFNTVGQGNRTQRP